MSTTHRTGCLICGAELAYEIDYKELECFICHKTHRSNVKCRNGHFVCDKCHSLSANDLIENFCVNSELKDPMKLATFLMNSPRLQMHGPEHHFLVPAVLLAAYYNIKGDPEQKKRKIRVARERSSIIPGGICGFHGDCGAAVGTGILVSLITEATPLSTKEWRLSNMMTSKSLYSVAIHGGPRCCKRNTFLSIIEVVKFLEENFGITMPIDKKIKCVFSPLNKKCLQEKCLFHSKRQRRSTKEGANKTHSET